jgi:hypothetical protein
VAGCKHATKRQNGKQAAAGIGDGADDAAPDERTGNITILQAKFFKGNTRTSKPLPFFSATPNCAATA